MPDRARQPGADQRAGHRVVVGLTEHDTSHAALRWAAAEAVRRGAEVHLVRVLTTPAPGRTGHRFEAADHWDASGFARTVDAHAQDALRDAAATVRGQAPRLRVVTRVRHGAPRRLLVEESGSADLLVVGSSRERTDGSAPEVLFTSRSDHLVTHAKCPVVVVGAAGGVSGDAGAGGGAGTASRGVVVGDDGSPAARAAVWFAAQEASWLEEPLTVVRAWWAPADAAPVDEPGGGHRSGATGEPELVALVAVLRREFGRLDAGWRLVREAEPWRALVAVGANARLVVVGSGGQSLTASPAPLVLGSTSRALLHGARGPVAVVPAGSAVHTPGRVPPGPSSSSWAS